MPRYSESSRQSSGQRIRSGYVSLDATRAPQGLHLDNPYNVNELRQLKARIAILERQVSSSEEHPKASGHRHQVAQTPTRATSAIGDCIDPAALQLDNGFDNATGQDAGHSLLCPLETYGHSGSNMLSVNGPGQSGSFSNSDFAQPYNQLEGIPNLVTPFSDLGQTPDRFDAGTTFLGQGNLGVDLDVQSDLNFDLDQFLDAPNTPAQIASAATTTPTMVPPTSARLACTHCRKVFKRRGDLERHRRLHDPTAPRLPCPFPGCTRVGSKAFLRSDKLMEHRRNKRH